MENEEESLKVEVISKEIWLCEKCNNYRGFVQEKYNGKVPVYCFCVFEEDKAKYGYWKSIRIICPKVDELFWDSCTQHKGSDGKWLLVVSLNKGLSINKKIMMQNTTKLNVTKHLESLGYKVGDAKDYGYFIRLEAGSDTKPSLSINIEKEGSLFFTQTLRLSQKKEEMNQKFLEILNKINGKFMFTKVFCKENERKEIMLYISTCTLSYSEEYFGSAMHFLESDSEKYREDLREFIE